jgi:hypothetical protein
MVFPLPRIDHFNLGFECRQISPGKHPQIACPLKGLNVSAADKILDSMDGLVGESGDFADGEK